MLIDTTFPQLSDLQGGGGGGGGGGGQKSKVWCVGHSCLHALLSVHLVNMTPAPLLIHSSLTKKSIQALAGALLR